MDDVSLFSCHEQVLRLRICTNVSRITGVALECMDTRQRLADLVQLLPIAASRDDRVAARQELPRKFLTDAVRASGDQDSSLCLLPRVP